MTQILGTVKNLETLEPTYPYMSIVSLGSKPFRFKV